METKQKILGLEAIGSIKNLVRGDVFVIQVSQSLDTLKKGTEVDVLNGDELLARMQSIDRIFTTFKILFESQSLATTGAGASMGSFLNNLVTVSNLIYSGKMNSMSLVLSSMAADGYNVYTEMAVIFNASTNKLSLVWFKERKSTDYLNIPSDGNTYGVRNGAAELIADDGEVVLTDYADTAMSLALDALNTGQLKISADTDPAMVEEVRELLGDELFNELAVQSVQTMELAPMLSDAEKISRAKEMYYKRKEAEAKLQLEMAELAEAEEISQSDVEPQKPSKK